MQIIVKHNKLCSVIKKRCALLYVFFVFFLLFRSFVSLWTRFDSADCVHACSKLASRLLADRYYYNTRKCPSGKSRRNKTVKLVFYIRSQSSRNDSFLSRVTVTLEAWSTEGMERVRLQSCRMLRGVVNPSLITADEGMRRVTRLKGLKRHFILVIR